MEAHLKVEAVNISRDRQLFPRYRPMGLSMNSACSKINNEQKQSKLSGYSIGSWAKDGSIKKLRIFTRVCLMWANQWVRKGTDKAEEKSVRAGPMKPLELLHAKSNRNCALKGICVYYMTPNQDIFLLLFPGYGPMGLSRKQECDKNRADRIKATYQSWAGQTRCYWFPCTVDGWGFSATSP